MLIARPKYTKLDLYNMAVQQVNDFCKLNNFPLPKISAGVAGPNSGFYRHNRNGGYIVVDLENSRYPVFKPNAFNPRNQSFTGNKTDRTPAGVVAHEVGHYIDFNTRYTLNLVAKFRSIIPLESSITSYDGDRDFERVAESMRLFILNPRLLEEGRPKAFEILRQRFKPIHKAPWTIMFHYAQRKEIYIDWCQKWIDRK